MLARKTKSDLVKLIRLQVRIKSPAMLGNYTTKQLMRHKKETLEFWLKELVAQKGKR